MLGDSISSIDYIRPNWWELIEQRTGCKFVDYGISGTTLAHTDDRHLWDYSFGKLDASEIGYDKNDPETWATGNCMCERWTKMDDDLDGLIVMGGTNDGAVPKGEWNSVDTSTFFGALNVLIVGLLKKYKGKPIIFCTPIQTSNGYSENVYDPLEALSDKRESNTLTLQLRAEAIKQKCQQYGIECNDLFCASGINGVDDEKVYYRTDDNLHPSDIGQYRISIMQETVLTKYYI